MSVAIIADWDADGTVAAAQLVYAQERLGLFPLRSKINVDLIPSGPRGFREKVYGKCWDCVTIVDIPFTVDVDLGLRSMVERGCKFNLYYFDHHDSTIKSRDIIENTYKAIVVIGSSSTSTIVKNFLEKLGVKLTPRLKQFIEAVEYIEGGSRNTYHYSEGVIKLALAISKHLNITKNLEIWGKYVRWLANPIPFDELELALGRDIPEIINESLKTSREADEELREIALNLAMSAKRVGYVRLVDARGKWSGRGASALASAIHKTLGEPVILLVNKDDGTTLVIARSSKGEASLLIDSLLEQGIVEDKGGHSNIAIARLLQEVTTKDLEIALIRASLRLKINRKLE
ncbi:MAG: phosphoesterase [Acidilobaceae archaeon]